MLVRVLYGRPTRPTRRCVPSLNAPMPDPRRCLPRTGISKRTQEEDEKRHIPRQDDHGRRCRDVLELLGEASIIQKPKITPVEYSQTNQRRTRKKQPCRACQYFTSRESRRPTASPQTASKTEDSCPLHSRRTRLQVQGYCNCDVWGAAAWAARCHTRRRPCRSHRKATRVQ